MKLLALAQDTLYWPTNPQRDRDSLLGHEMDNLDFPPAARVF